MKRAALPLLTCLLALTACSTTVTGIASDSAGNSPGPVIPTGLDVGQNPTTLREVPTPSNDQAWVAEGNRMGDALIQVNEVDPRLTIGGIAKRSYPVLRGTQLIDRVPDATKDAFWDNDMRVGMTTTRGNDFDNPTVAVRIGLYRFDDPDTAAKTLAKIKAGTARNKQIAISSTDGVSATEFKPGTVDSYRTEGPFVINVSGTAPTTDEAARFVTKAYELETPKVKAFTPTPVSSILSLPADKDGIVARTIYENADSVASMLNNGYFDLTGLLHRVPDLASADAYRQAGVDLVGQGKTFVYRTRDAAAASALPDALARVTKPNPTKVPAAGPTGLPTVKCSEYTDDHTGACTGTVGRYMFTLSADSLRAAQQLAAAQYTILAKNP